MKIMKSAILLVFVTTLFLSCKENKQSDAIHEIQVEEIAKKKGLLVSSDKSHPIVEGLFKEESTKEELFLYKLQLFELSEIKASKDRATKALLRKALTIRDVTKYAIKIFEDQEDLNKTEAE